MIASSGYVILICGGSSSGKTSAANHLKKISTPPKLFHLDFDDQVLKLCNGRFNGDIKESFLHLVNCLPEAAVKSSFFMDHWMPPKYENLARQKLNEFSTFYVWLACSSEEELKRREALRINAGDFRGEGITEAGQVLPESLEYDCVIDTFGKNPKKVANLIHKKARRHWGLCT